MEASSPLPSPRNAIANTKPQKATDKEKFLPTWMLAGGGAFNSSEPEQPTMSLRSGGGRGDLPDPAPLATAAKAALGKAESRVTAVVHLPGGEEAFGYLPLLRTVSRWTELDARGGIVPAERRAL